MAGGAIRAFGRVVRAAVFPVGIDVEGIAALAAAADNRRASIRRLRQHPRPGLADRRRPARLFEGVAAALRGLFVSARTLSADARPHGVPADRPALTLGRSRVPGNPPRTRSRPGRINGRFAEFDWTPLRYLNKSFNHRILTGFYRAAKLALVTPLRDGMNLVAKEYVASQDPENPGMPILSCFAGAAHELGEAILVNPNDVEGVAEAIVQGLDIPVGERKERWSAMMATLRRNNADSWRRRFVEALAAGAAR